MQGLTKQYQSDFWENPSTQPSFIQVYAPTTDSEDDIIEIFYATIPKEIDCTPNQGILIIIGDSNTIVGNKAESNVDG